MTRKRGSRFFTGWLRSKHCIATAAVPAHSGKGGRFLAGIMGFMARTGCTSSPGLRTFKGKDTCRALATRASSLAFSLSFPRMLWRVGGRSLPADQAIPSPTPGADRGACTPSVVTPGRHAGTPDKDGKGASTIASRRDAIFGDTMNACSPGAFGVPGIGDSGVPMKPGRIRSWRPCRGRGKRRVPAPLDRGLPWPPSETQAEEHVASESDPLPEEPSSVVSSLSCVSSTHLLFSAGILVASDVAGAILGATCG